MKYFQEKLDFSRLWSEVYRIAERKLVWRAASISAYDSRSYRGGLLRILIPGNMGYVGPAVVRRLRARYPNAEIIGFDMGYFAHCLTGVSKLPEAELSAQWFGDLRDLESGLLEGCDAVVQLAAISNDPISNAFSEVTRKINQEASLTLASMAAKAGVRKFVFASSCSVYGVADGPARREEDPPNPITPYAISKIGAEQGLCQLDTDMQITCLRFGTACGMSARLRLDLVLNDFVASALSTGRIKVLSDGTPWRPLVDTADMALAVEWAIERKEESGGRFLVVNMGSDVANYQVADLAHAVAEALPGTDVSINHAAPDDSRSYRVDFGLYKRLAPQHQPRVTLQQSVAELVAGLRAMSFRDRDFRHSRLIRLRVIEQHVAERRLDSKLRWISSKPREAVS
jgi:nucleoside-diphosphate-sugar epimerase